MDEWRRMGGELPEAGVPIEIDWVGTVFQARFVKAFMPWGIAWDLDVDYFTGWTRKLIATSQITRWRYTPQPDQGKDGPTA